MLPKKYLYGKGRRDDNFQYSLLVKDWALSLLDRYNNHQARQRSCGNINKITAKISEKLLTKYFTNVEETFRQCCSK